LTSKRSEQVYCSSSGGTTLYIQQLVCVMLTHTNCCIYRKYLLMMSS